jgi:hypothetical protein
MNLEKMDAQYQPTSRRQRLKIVAVTVATVVILWMLLLFRPGGHPRTYPQSTPVPCSPGQAIGCVGGRADVSLISAAASAEPGRASAAIGGR